MINMNIDLGNIITLVGMLITLVTFGASLRASVATLTTRVGSIEFKIDKQTDNYNVVLIDRIHFEHKVAMLEERLENAIREFREARIPKETKYVSRRET